MRKTPISARFLIVVFAVVFGGAVLVASGEARADKIASIEIVENSKTTDATVAFLAQVEVGDEFSLDLVKRIKVDLVSSGLFQEVEVLHRPAKAKDGTIKGVHLIISAEDKHSWVIAPTFYNQPTNKGFGVGFGENNLFGENKKLLLYGQVATGDTFFIGAYVDPSIRGTRWNWQADVFLRRERIFEYATPTDWFDDPQPVRRSKLNYLNGGITLGTRLIGASRLSARLRGAHVSYDQVGLAEGADPEDIRPGAEAGDPVPAPGAEGWDISTIIALTYNSIANWYGVTSGDKFKLSLEQSLASLGSEFDYWIGFVQYRRARKYYERHNWIIDARLGYGSRVPFQQEFTSGGIDLRGFENRQLRGNFRAALTAEYSVQLLEIKGWAFRGLVFGDSTYTGFVNTRYDGARDVRNYLPQHDRLGLSPFKNTVGLGTRLYVKQIVLPLLGLDVGYGIERKSKEIYFAIGLTGF